MHIFYDHEISFLSVVPIFTVQLQPRCQSVSECGYIGSRRARLYFVGGSAANLRGSTPHLMTHNKENTPVIRTDKTADHD